MKQKKPNFDRKFTVQELKDYHAEAVKRFQQARSYWSVIYQRAESDVEFRHGNQWIDAARGDRGDRPVFTQNLTNSFVDRVVNEGVKLNPEIIVSASDIALNPNMADDLQGRIRFIEQSSNASVAYTTALDYSASGGFGFIRLRNEYKDKSSFDQKISIERVINPFSVMLDPKFKEITGSDAMWGFQVEKMPIAQYDDEYPNRDHENWPDTPFILGDWYDGEQVTVCEYAFQIQEEDEIVHLEDGREALASEMLDADGNPKPEYAEAKVSTTRKTTRDCVAWLKMDGNRVLESTIIPSRYIPWVFVAGIESVINYRRDFLGLVHRIRDSQTEINYYSSVKTELIALSPKAPWIVEFSQIRGLEQYWDNANTANFSYLPYNATIIEGSNGAVAPPPQRTNFEPQIQAVTQAEQAAFERMKQITGIYDLGMPTPIGTESPDAILLRQEQADSSILKFLYNMKMSVTQVGRIIVDMLPSLTSHEQDMKFMKPDDTVMTKKVGPNTFDYSPDDLDVVVSTGKSFTTRKAEVGKQMNIFMGQVAQVAPEKASSLLHIYAEQLDMGPAGKMVAEILKKQVDPKLLAIDGQQPQMNPDQVQAILKQQDDLLTAAHAQIVQLTQEVNDKTADRESKMEIEILKSRTSLAETEIKADAEIQAARAKITEHLISHGDKPVDMTQNALKPDAVIPYGQSLVQGLPTFQEALSGQQQPLPTPPMPQQFAQQDQAPNAHGPQMQPPAAP